jgi:hypothetical protein
VGGVGLGFERWGSHFDSCEPCDSLFDAAIVRRATAVAPNCHQTVTFLENSAKNFTQTLQRGVLWVLGFRVSQSGHKFACGKPRGQSQYFGFLFCFSNFAVRF